MEKGDKVVVDPGITKRDFGLKGLDSMSPGYKINSRAY